MEGKSVKQRVIATLGQAACEWNQIKQDLGERLVQDRELIITRDGKPIAIMVGIEPEELETSLEEIRRAD